MASPDEMPVRQMFVSRLVLHTNTNKHTSLDHVKGWSLVYTLRERERESERECVCLCGDGGNPMASKQHSRGVLCNWITIHNRFSSGYPRYMSVVTIECILKYSSVITHRHGHRRERERECIYEETIQLHRCKRCIER